MVYKKHIFTLSIEEWIQSPNKLKQNISIIWKAVITSFPLIESGLAWKVGDRSHLRVGIDPWFGSINDHCLPMELTAFMQERGLYALNQVAAPNHTSLSTQGWLSRR